MRTLENECGATVDMNISIQSILVWGHCRYKFKDTVTMRVKTQWICV